MAKHRTPKRAASKKRQDPRPERPTRERHPKTETGRGTARGARAPATSSNDRPSRAWLIRCAPGLAKLATAELRHLKVLGGRDRVDVLWQRNHDMLFLPQVAANPVQAAPRLAQDLDRCVIYGRYKVSARQLDRLAKALEAKPVPTRIVVTAEGQHFNRQDLKRFLGRELASRGVRISESAERTVFVFCVDQAYYVALPEGGADTVPGRSSRTAEREGSLPPTIAAAMAFIARPTDDDTILDPVCGSGTLLAEASGFAPDARLIGRDLDSRAVAVTRGNLAERNANVVQGDARDLDLPDGGISIIMANLPFGKQFGDAAENPALYREIFAEFRRVGSRGTWRAVVLAADADAVRDAAEAEGLRVRQTIPLRVRGEPANIVELTRRL